MAGPTVGEDPAGYVAGERSARDAGESHRAGEPPRAGESPRAGERPWASEPPRAGGEARGPRATSATDEGPLARLQVELAGLAEEALADDVDDETLLASVTALQRLQSAVEAERLRRLAELTRREAHVGRARSAEELAAEALGSTRGHARGQVRTAAALRLLPRTRATYATGALDAAKIRLARRLAEEITDARERGQPVAADAHDQLDALVATRGPEASWAELRRLLDRWTRRAVPELLADRERNAHARRFLHTRQGPDGLRLSARLDVRGGTLVLTALDALSRLHGPEDERTYEQRRADALAALAEGYLDAGDLPQRARQRPHLLLLADREALGDDPDAPAPLLDGYGPVSGPLARQIADDAATTLVLRDDQGVPDAVGRTQRYPNRALRVRVTTRDEGCVGCSAPINRCQFHHIVPWHHGGPTTVDNLCLLCPACHHKLHHYGWRVEAARTGAYWLAPPPGRGHGPGGRDAAGDHPSDPSDPSDPPSRRRTG